jgi:hypothetical protein
MLAVEKEELAQTKSNTTKDVSKMLHPQAKAHKTNILPLEEYLFTKQIFCHYFCHLKHNYFS